MKECLQSVQTVKSMVFACVCGCCSVGECDEYGVCVCVWLL